MGETAVAMIELGIETGETVEAEARETIVECPDVTLGATIMTDHRVGIGIFLKAAWIETEVVAVEDLPEAIGTSSRCRWAVEKTVQVLRLRRKSLHPT